MKHTTPSSTYDPKRREYFRVYMRERRRAAAAPPKSLWGGSTAICIVVGLVVAGIVAFFLTGKVPSLSTTFVAPDDSSSAGSSQRLDGLHGLLIGIIVLLVFAFIVYPQCVKDAYESDNEF